MNLSRPLLKVLHSCTLSNTSSVCYSSLPYSHLTLSLSLSSLYLFSTPCLSLSYQAVTSAGYSTPTPIQANAVPVALMGRDICACAATGTGTGTRRHLYSYCSYIQVYFNYGLINRGYESYLSFLFYGDSKGTRYNKGYSHCAYFIIAVYSSQITKLHTYYVYRYLSPIP